MSRLDTLYLVHSKTLSHQIDATTGLSKYALNGRTKKEAFPQLTILERYKLNKVVYTLSSILNQMG